MRRFWTAILISVFIIAVHIISIIVSYKLGLQKEELLKSLTTTVPSVFSVLVAIFIAFFSSRRETIHWHTVSTQIDWRIRVRIQIINFRSFPIYDLTVQGEYPSFRLIQQPPESIPSLEKGSLIFELGKNPTEQDAINQINSVSQKKYCFLIGYRDGSRPKIKYKPIHIKNPMYIPFVHMKLLYRKVIKLCLRIFSIGQGH